MLCKGKIGSELYRSDKGSRPVAVNSTPVHRKYGDTTNVTIQSVVRDFPSSFKAITGYARNTVTDVWLKILIHSTMITFHIHFNIILPSTTRSCMWSLSFRFPFKTYIRLFSPHTCHMPRPSESSRFDHPNNI